jgi:hypothetical protein
VSKNKFGAVKYQVESNTPRADLVETLIEEINDPLFIAFNQLEIMLDESPADARFYLPRINYGLALFHYTKLLEELNNLKNSLRGAEVL